MNLRRSASHRILTASAAALLLAAALPAGATILNWDTNSADGLTTSGGTGAWDTTSLFWTQDGVSYAPWVNANLDQAVFGGTAGTVTLGTGISANTLTFNTTGYTITGNTLTMGGTTPTITVGTGLSDTVSSVIAGTAGLVVNGGGNLTLTNANTYTGGTTVNAGTLTLTGTSGTGRIRGVLTINAGANVIATTADALGYTAGQQVDTVNINGGTFTNGVNANNGYNTKFVLTGGTLTESVATNGTAGINFNAADANNYGITTLASSTTSTISARLSIRTGNLTFNVAQGTTASGIDLNVTKTIFANGGAGIIKTGNGTMALAAQATYTGGTTVNGGILDLTAGGGQVGIIRGTATVNAGATLRLSTGDAVGYDTGVPGNKVTVLNVNGGTLRVNTTANQTFSTMNLTLNAGTISGIAGSNIDLFNNGTVINTTAAATSSVISLPTLGLRQNDTTFNVADGAAPVDLLVSSVLTNGSAQMQGNHNLVKTGNGLMQITATNTYTGTTTVNAGTLALSGTGSLASPTITITSGALLDVSGLSAGALTLNAGQTLAAGRTSGSGTDVIGNVNGGSGIVSPGGPLLAGTMTLGGTGAGNLTLNGGTVSFDLANVATVGGGVNDLLSVHDLTLNGTTSIAINKLNGLLASSTYTLINYTGALTGTASNLTLSGAAGGTTRQSFALDTTTTPGSVLLNVSGVTANLKWAGDGVANNWDVATTANFLNGASPDKYYDGDSVTFDDTGSNTPDIQLAANLVPASLTVNNATKDYHFVGGVISGSTGLTKSGNAKLTLDSTTNTFTGAVAINGGTLSAGTLANSGVASSLGSGNAVSIGDATHAGKLQLTATGVAMTTNRTLGIGAGGATIEIVDSLSSLTISPSLVLNGNLTKSGNGGLTLSAPLSGAGGITETGGTVTAAARSSYTGDLIINGGTFTTTVGLSDGVTTPLGAGSGTRNIIVGAGAQMIWTVNNTFIGGGGNAANLPTITLNGGVLSSTRFNVVPNIVLNDGALLTQSATDGPGAYEGYQFIGTVTVGGAIPSSITTGNGRANHLKGGATTTFNVANVTGDSNPDLIVSTPIKDGSGDYAGVGALQKTGAGTLQLIVPSVYTGATTIANGTLSLSSTGALASTAINVGATGTFDVSGVTNYSLNAGATLTVTPGGQVVGPLTLPAGTALIAGRTASPATDFAADLISSGTLRVAGDATAGTFTIGSGGSLVLTGGTVSFDLSNTTTAGGGVDDLVNVSGSLSLSGTTNISVNTLNAVLTAGNYTLITYAGGLGGDTSNLNLVGVTPGPRQTFALDLNTTPGALLLKVTGQAGNLTWVGDGVTNAWDHTTVNNWSGAADNRFFDQDNVTFTDTGSNTPAIQVTGTLAPHAVVVNNTSKDYTFAGAGSISGTTGITKSGNGTLTITNTNSFTGPVAINQGTVSVPVIDNGGVNSALGAGTSVTLGDATHQGTLRFTAVAATSSTNRVLTLNDGGGAIDVADAGTNLTVASVITGTGGLTKAGNGTLTLSAVNTYTGGTTVNAGTLALTAGGAAGTVRGTLTINAGGTVVALVKDGLGYGADRVSTLNINGGTYTHNLAANNTTMWGMAINMTGGILQATNGQLDLGTNANANNVPTVLNTFASTNTATLGGVNVTLRQPVTAFTVADGAAEPDLLVTAPINEGDVGSGISKSGPGTMKIVTNGTYTGATTINAGKLILNASIAGSAVSVQGGILTGNGTTGTLSVASGGTVAPGDGVGILNTKNTVLALGSTLSLELNTSTPATGYDQLNVTGTVDVTGATLTLGGSYHGGATNDVFFVLLNDGTDAVTGTFNGLAEGSHVLSGTGQDFIITYLADSGTSSLTGGNDVALQAVPEPGTMVSLLGGFGLLVGLGRRRKMRR